MLSRRPVLREHVLPLIGLVVRPDQVDLVSSNSKTLAQAAYETGSYVWGLWDEETLVGLMAMIHPGEYPWDAYQAHEPGDNGRCVYLWRLMIGADFQGKGYGSAALAQAFAQTKAWGYARLTAHVSDVAHSNLGFYQSHGFQSTGIVEDGELVIAINL